MNAIHSSLSSTERIDQRNAMRNLDTFLAFDFSRGSRLGILNQRIYGTAIERLSSVKQNQLTWCERLTGRWNRTYDLGRVCSHISKQIPTWINALAHDDERFVALERNLALLERIVIVYNGKISKERPEWETVTFTNPLRRFLYVQIHYPRSLDKQDITTIKREIPYDRLTSQTELETLINKAANQAVPLNLMADKDWNSSVKASYTLNVNPSHVFKKMSQNPDKPADPAKESARSDIQVINFTFDQVDWPSIASTLYIQGQNEAMPRVYQQGIADGKQMGYREAILAITNQFHKAVTAK